jgi:hypothetical protein
MTFSHLKSKNIIFLDVDMKKNDVFTREIEKHHLSMKKEDVFDEMRCDSKKKFDVKNSAALCTR